MPAGKFGRCCEDCQIYWTCEAKWYRGERYEDDICCETCNYYRGCKEQSKGSTNPPDDSNKSRNKK